MKRLLLALALLVPASAFACDTYVSTTESDRTLRYDQAEWTVTVTDDAWTKIYRLQSGGAGSGIVIAVSPEDITDAFEVKSPSGEFWLGPEKFVCK